ncbi:MAG: VWA domain-containing protein [Candidatus Thioglobus sp.]|nr:VWA domain-containing protein [Candidatus Thioglobus sp.]
MKPLLLILCLTLSTLTFAGKNDTIKSSLLLLIDSSGSMSNAIGNGNQNIKIESAKRAAIESVAKAVANNLVEVAILAFEGGCANPVPSYVNFTTDETKLTDFIHTLQPGGGTPMADAVLFANKFMQDNGKPNALSQMIVLLADGQNDCGNVKQAMATLQASGAVFRHETVGFGIEPNSQASSDLRYIASSSGGSYHHANSATQLADVLIGTVDTLSVIDMLGQFKYHSLGKNKPAKPKIKRNKKPSISMDLLDRI